MMLLKGCILGKEFPFAEYKITETEIFAKEGVFSQRTDCVDIRKIKDVAVEATFLDRLVGQSTVILYVKGDATDDVVYLRNIKKADEVVAFIKSKMEVEFEKRRSRSRFVQYDNEEAVSDEW